MKRNFPWLALAAVVLIACVAVYGFDAGTALYAASSHHDVMLYVAEGAAAVAFEKQIEQLSADLKKAGDEVKKIADDTNKEVKSLGKSTEETKVKADEAMTKYNEIAARLTEIEQKMVRKGEGPQRSKSIGEQFTENADVKNFLVSKKSKGSVNMQFKAIISALTTDADGSAGDLIVPQRIPGIFGLPERRMTIRDLLTPGRTSSNAVQYVKETGFTNLAATVTETAGTAKAQSEIKFDIATSNVSTIAHWVLATKQILDDVPMLQSYIDGRLRYGLMYVEETQLLMGGGTGTDLNGIYTQATAYSDPISDVTGKTAIDVIRAAMLQAFLAEYPPTGTVLNPKDWARMELIKDGIGRYLIGNPQGTIEKKLWGLPVVDTQAMTEDKFLVGAFKLGAQIFDREDANVEISTEDSDNFRKNLVTIRAEERIALAVYRTEAFIKGDLGNI